MIKTDSRESMTDQQRWVMDNLLGETVTSTQYEVANLPAYGIRGSRSYQPYIIATNQLGMKIHEPVSRLINKSPIDSQGYLTALLKQVMTLPCVSLNISAYYPLTLIVVHIGCR